MPTRRSSCSQCLRPIVSCYCHTISRVNNPWPVALLQHPLETKHAIGTARIAQLSLHNCNTFISDQPEQMQQFSTFINQQAPLLVYPAADSLDISEVDKDEVRPLLFIDANWRKSRRLLHELPQLQQLQKISFIPKKPSRYRIRKVPNAKALSTLEAIAWVLSTLEKNPRKYQPLLKSMDWMIDQQIQAMNARLGSKVNSNNALNAEPLASG